MTVITAEPITYPSGPNYITAQPIASGETPYNLPRQTGTGVQRGTQTIAGQLVVVDPTNNNTIVVIGYAPNAFA